MERLNPFTRGFLLVLALILLALFMDLAMALGKGVDWLGTMTPMREGKAGLTGRVWTQCLPNSAIGKAGLRCFNRDHDLSR